MTKHTEPPRCSVPGCEEPGWKWFEDPAYPKGTRYVCADHIEAFFTGAPDDYQAKNSAGETVEIAEYACRDNCRICWQ